MKFLVCFGTRPEAIKMAPVIYQLKQRGLSFKICVTAQHREMLDQVIDFFEIKPDFDLNLMEPNQSLNRLSARILTTMDEVLEQEKPDVVLVHGDTSTSAMVALAAFHRQIKVGHVEAGLRTFNKAAPFPEEMNRQLTGRITDFHFAPTALAKNNLLKENIRGNQIYLTGNTVVDAIKWAADKTSFASGTKEINDLDEQLDPKKKLILFTGHRRENFGRGFESIFKALRKIGEREDVEILYPVHPNPNLKSSVTQFLKDDKNILLVPPLSYPAMVWLIKKAGLIISDSGGMQEEAPAFKKQVLVTRELSERMEGVQAGFSILVGTDTERIVSEANKALDNPADLSGIENPFGDGKASERIIDALMGL
ncbi:non-hydrolyzing UDP-N-acetylglucosamine 2-epimerase [Salinimicrobium sediminilitoris]|uniref:non-hydrolyzing UDP-N-acetylglucosamine 2-epimerase n=1 Tax=Salinimicrobium sediminilitoris TaxID=2876715 RepID=UPI001E369D76|nr:UDP-N-acetylglucosamine 2-epimerase (non-hydrolyzing) [Salinimicrobium sediminilitoris]MCC8358528.1 UDP-N-acetylglucosamine 2-epimerase (non-hydrolyzing) [Salinimicrobium sediminilitoris]